MRRLATLPLCVCLVAPLWSGCQSAQRTARVERTSPGSFWSAEGQKSRTELVSTRKGAGEVRFASRSNRNGGSSLSGLLSGGGSDRIPLPRTDGDGLRNLETPGANDQPIGAF